MTRFSVFQADDEVGHIVVHLAVVQIENSETESGVLGEGHRCRMGIDVICGGLLPFIRIGGMDVPAFLPLFPPAVRIGLEGNDIGRVSGDLGDLFGEFFVLSQIITARIIRRWIQDDVGEVPFPVLVPG